MSTDDGRWAVIRSPNSTTYCEVRRIISQAPKTYGLAKRRNRDYDSTRCDKSRVSYFIPGEKATDVEERLRQARRAYSEACSKALDEWQQAMRAIRDEFGVREEGGTGWNDPR